MTHLKKREKAPENGGLLGQHRRSRERGDGREVELLVEHTRVVVESCRDERGGERKCENEFRISEAQ